MKKLIVMGACSVLFLVLNQVAVERGLIDPFMYLLALIGGGGALVLSVGEIFVIKGLERLEEMDKEESKENIYTPKL